ncbi:hypothetical protein [Streptomyces sp. NPDC056883]|uniref:hypothetical protein n=1 Tax=Streptomyces sp. NPDC056883 TaxID=3345959 RepID=UPI0036927248
MYLIHLLLRADHGLLPDPPTVDPSRHATALAAAGIEHLTTHGGPEPGTAVLTAFVRARTLAEAESQACEACWSVLTDEWTVSAVWPGLVAEYYTGRRAPDLP